MSLRKNFAETITKIARIDPKLVMFVGDISHGIFGKLREEFPERYYNIGICEPAMVNVAAGLSAQGLTPVVHTIAPFLIERSYEQIKLDFAYQELGINLISVGGAFDYSKLGCSHHCYTDYSLISEFKQANIYFPGSDIEFETLFRENYTNRMINYFRLTEYPHNFVFKENEINSGKAIKVRKGEDLTIFTTGALLGKVIDAASELKSQGVSVEIVYFHTLKPFDHAATLSSVLRTRKFITFEDISENNGLFKLVNETVSGKLIYKSKQIAINDFIRIYGTYDALCDSVGLTTSNLVYEATKMVKSLDENFS